MRKKKEEESIKCVKKRNRSFHPTIEHYLRFTERKKETRHEIRFVCSVCSCCKSGVRRLAEGKKQKHKIVLIPANNNVKIWNIYGFFCVVRERTDIGHNVNNNNKMNIRFETFSFTRRRIVCWTTSRIVTSDEFEALLIVFRTHTLPVPPPPLTSPRFHLTFVL